MLPLTIQPLIQRLLRYAFVCIPFLMVTSRSGHAQVVHAGPWTGYVDGTSVTNMIMRDSMLFVTTYNGTARVDPETHSYQYFRDMGVAGLPSVLNLKYAALNAQGQLWFIADHKLMHLDPDLSLHVAGDEPQYQVTVMRFDHQDRLWAGFYTPFVPPTTGEALAQFNGSGWDYIDVGTPSLNVLDIAFDADDQPWFTTFTKIYRFNGTAFEVVRQNGVNIIGGSRIVIAEDGQIAVAGSYNTDGLKYFNTISWTTYQDDGYAFPVFDAGNMLWVNDRFGHVYRMHPSLDEPELVLSTAENYRTGGQEYINGLGIDHQGALWIGKNSGLFTAADPFSGSWSFVALSDPLVPAPHPEIAAIGDTAWLLTDAGLTLRINDSFEKLNLPQTDISAIDYDVTRKGLWVGSPGTIGFYSGNTQELININPLLRDSVNHNGISQIKTDPSGNVWLLVYDGILRYDASGQWKTFYQGEELPHAPVGFSKMTLSYTDHSVWVRINGFSTKAFTEPPMLIRIKDDVVTDTHFDEEILKNYPYFGVVSDSVLWFGSTYYTVIRYDHGIITEYTPGPLNAEEWIIYNDSTVFLCSNLGLYVFKDEEWFKPVIASDQIANDDALPAYLTADGQLYLANYSLLVLTDIESMLGSLVTSTHTVDQASFRCFPNPVTDVLYLDPSLTFTSPDCTAEIWSADGQLIRRVTSPGSQPIDVHDLLTGGYVLRIRDANSTRFVTKVIKL